MTNHTIVRQSDIEVEFEVKLDEKYILPHKTHVLEHLKAHIKVAGFRPGKMPDAIAERELGSEKVQTEVLQDLIMHSYGEALTNLKLEVIADPQITLSKFVPYSTLEYRAMVAVMPPVKLPDLTKVKINNKPEEVTDAELDEAVAQLAKNATKHKTLKRAAKLGDGVKFDFVGTRQGKPVEGAIGNNQILTLGEGKFIPGFEDNLIGMSAGEEKDFKITFPKDYHQPDLQSAEVDFYIKMIEVAQVVIPKLDNEFAKSMGGFKTLDVLRQDLKRHLEDGKKNKAEQKFRSDVLDEVISKTKLSVPTSLVDDQIKSLRDQMNQELAQNGLDEAKYLEFNKKQKSDYENELKTEADRRVKLGLILRSIVKEQKMDVNEQEIDVRLTQLEQQYSDPQIRAEIAKPEFKQDLKNRMLSDKAIEYIINRVKGK